MACIVCVVGKTKAGKTTLLEKLVAELSGRGYRVGTVKHDGHGFDIDHEGKDSWRHKAAGAEATVISAPSKLALIRDADHDHSLDEVHDHFLWDFDVVLAEGYKSSTKPKIEVHRRENSPALLCGPHDDLLAVASDEPLEVQAPCYDIDDAAGLADLIENQYLKKPFSKVSMLVNGRPITLVHFVRALIPNAIIGLICTLKGCEHARRVEVKFDIEG